MPDPVIDIFENDSDSLGNGTPINDSNPVAFGIVPRGAISVPLSETQFPIHVWNDQGGANGSDDATTVKVNVVAADNDNDIPLFNGTELNGFTTMIEARSTDAFNTVADNQSTWTPISPSALLSIGDLPSNSRRGIEIRANIPIDCPAMALTQLLINVNYI